jgi:hypothetical protein
MTGRVIDRPSLLGCRAWAKGVSQASKTTALTQLSAPEPRVFTVS